MGRFPIARVAGSAGLTALTLLLSGCGSAEQWGRFGFPEGITSESEIVQNLWRGSWIAALAVGVGVWGLILGACWLYRRRSYETGMPPQVRYNVPIEALYTVLPFIIISVLFFFTARDEARILDLAEGQVENEINVVGKQWSWDFNYTTSNGTPANVYVTGTPATPPELVLPRGEKVRFVLNARDVIHSFWVPAFLFKQDVIPGRTNRFEVTPTQTGTFVGKCAEFCGLDHSRMLFSVRVVEPAEYDAYLQGLRDAGQTGSLPANELGPGAPERADTEAEARP